MSTDPAPPEAWVDDLAEGVVLIRDGRIAYLNRAAAEFLGSDPARSRGRTPMAVLRDHRLERVWLQGRAAEVTLRGRRLVVVPIAGGLALRDASEAHRARTHAEELLAVLSHELRTPLTTVRSTLDAFGYDDLPEATRSRLLTRAGEEADRLIRLVGDLTTFIAPPRERSVDLGATVERARAVVAPTLAGRNVRLVAEGPWPTVWADPDKVLQILINLIENAALHGPEGGTIHVRSEEVGRSVRLTVRDDGTPLPSDAFERLFAPHARATPGATSGGGLGLYVVRTIAERAGGKAWGAAWHDGPDVAGNEFGVALPARREAAGRRDG